MSNPRNEQILDATINGTAYSAAPQSRLEEKLLQLKQVIESSGANTYTKSEVDNLISAIVQEIDWKEAVATFADLATTYPDAVEGWTASVLDTDDIYRYNGTAWVNIYTLPPLATSLSAGLMSSGDKSKLDGIESGAQVNAVTGVKGDSETMYRAGDINITKANIGLDNVDNTSDANKPISTAAQAALDGKADSADLAAVATSGDYNDLTNTPTSLPANGGNADTVSGFGGSAFLRNYPNFAFDQTNAKDVDSVTSSGVYSGNNWENAPLSTEGTLLVIRYFDNDEDFTGRAAAFGIQIFIIASRTMPKLYYRFMYTTGGTQGFSAWAECALKTDQTNFLGNGTGYTYPYVFGENLNTVKTEYHKFVIHSTNYPAEAYSHGFLDVSYYSGADFTLSGSKPIIRQIYCDWSNFDQYIRFYTEYNDTWTEWKKICNSDDIADIETDDGTGDETTENYVRFANGFCVQWGSKENVTSGANFTFPYAFTDIPSVSVNRGIVGSITTGGFAMTADSAASDDTIYYTAIGYIN